MDGSFDLSKIISMVAENPELVSSFKSMLSSVNTTESNKNGNSTINDENQYESKPLEKENERQEKPLETEPAIAEQKNTAILRKRRRKELLCALKPYVCSERSKAIDTMLSLTDVLDVLKES